MSLVLQWEPVQCLLDEGLEKLLYRHWREVALDQEEVPLDPDWSCIWRMEQQGVFRTAALRRDSKLIGYSAFCIIPHLHHRGTLHALNDVIYVDPQERGAAGVKLIRGCERMLKELGVRKIVYHSKLHLKLGRKQKTIGDLLDIMGYKAFETSHSRLIG